MAEKIVMTALSPTMEVGTIANWVKQEGQTVASGDVLCEVETDKTSMEYESVQEGVLLKIICGAGGEARIGDAIAIIGEKGEDVADLLKEIEQERAEAQAAAASAASQPAASAATPASAAAAQSAAPVAPAAPATGPTSATSATSPAAAPAPATSAVSPAAATTPTPAAPAADGWVSSSPLARKIANDHSIPIAQVAGSGPGGRVIKRDIEAALAQPSAGRARFIPSSPSAAPRADTIVPVAGIRKVIAQRTAASVYSAPHYYLSVAIDMQSTIAARNTLNASLKKQGKKVSFNAFLLKFAAEALKLFPHINASWEGEQIRLFGSINIGLTVDLGNGLMTPIVPDCDRKGVVEIDDHLTQLIEKVRAGTLRSEEYQGATHTISNLGSFGIDAFTGVINPPGAAIWAIGRTAPTPVVDEQGEIVVRPIMNTTLSCDHRVIDGKLAAEYLGTLKGFMENPASLIY